MLNSWFGSRSSRRSQPPRTPSTLHNDKSVASSVTQSTVGPARTISNLTSGSEVPLDDSHTNVYAPTPSLIHSAEKEAATVGTSDAPSASAGVLPDQRDSSQITKGDGTLFGVFTPQDAIIAQVFGRSVPPPTDDPVQTTPPPTSTSAPQPSMSLTVSDSLPSQIPPASSARPGPTFTIYDPFSGVKLGERSPILPSVNTSTPGEVSSTQSEAVGTADDRKLWTSLERILELQAEIAGMHAAMEGVGGRAGSAHVGGGVVTGEGRPGPRKRSRRGLTLPVGDEEPEEHGPESGHPGSAFSEISTDRSDDEDEDEDEDIFGNGKKRRDEEFAKLAEQFAQRKTAIGGIVDKLDDLSTALKTFHALPPPILDFATSPSRRATVSSQPSNASGASSLPPLHMYLGESSSPPPSASPSQTRMPITPPSAPLPPPVPPISILAPTLFPGGPGSLTEPVIAPILPRMAMPMIIPGAPQVESPADIHPAQSTFQGALQTH